MVRISYGDIRRIVIRQPRTNFFIPNFFRIKTCLKIKNTITKCCPRSGNKNLNYEVHSSILFLPWIEKVIECYLRINKIETVFRLSSRKLISSHLLYKFLSLQNIYIHQMPRQLFQNWSSTDFSVVQHWQKILVGKVFRNL